MLWQRSVQRQPLELRNRMQRSWLGSGGIESVPSFETRPNTTSSRQLAKQQPGPQIAQSASTKTSQTQQQVKSRFPTTKSDGWNRSSWLSRDARSQSWHGG